MLESSLIEYFEGREGEILTKLRQLVEIESGSYHKIGVDQAGTFMIQELTRLGFKVTSFSQKSIGNQIVGYKTFGGKGRVLLLGHLDTVWPVGTLKEWPFALTDAGFATGPGIGDMKGGLIVALAALEALVECHLCQLESITFVLVPDEELGSPLTRSLIEAEGRKANWAFVMEPGRPKGGVVTSRGVVGSFVLRARGRTAHCGVNYAEGSSAVRELALKVEPMESLSVPKEGKIINVGIFRGGEARQVIPGDAEIHIDLRAPDNEECNKLTSQMKAVALAPINPKVQLFLEGGQTRPAFPRSAGVLALYQRAASIAEEMKIPLPEVHTIGGSDGSFVAAQGIPTLDGLGPITWEACSRRERILLESLTQRAQLLAHLMAVRGGKNDQQ